MKNFIRLQLLCAACLSTFAAPLTAEVYRWVDSEGKTHYGDRPPKERADTAKPVEIKAAPARIDPEAERSRQQLRTIEEGRRRQREFEEQKAAQAQQHSDELARRCKALQEDIRDDRNVAVFYRYDDAGKRVLWTSEERLAYRQQLQQWKETYCPGLPE